MTNRNTTIATRITDVVDNRAADGFAAEHGLSPLIEHGDERILFDTGAALRPNAAKLGIDLGGVPHIAIRTIVGGLHLCHATDEEIAQTGDFLRQLNLDQLVLLHCTGETAGAKLKEMLSCLVVWGSAGSVLVKAGCNEIFM